MSDQNRQIPGSYSEEEIAELRAIQDTLRDIHKRAVELEKWCSDASNNNTQANALNAIANSAGHYIAVTKLLKEIEKDQHRTAQGRSLPRP